MRTLLVIAATSFLMSQYGMAQGRGGRGGAQPAKPEPPPPPNPGFECFDRLETPEFPRAALQAHVDGTVYTLTQVNAQGGADKVDTKVVSAWSDGPKLLTPPVEKAIRASKVKSDCAGKTVAIVFRYQLYGEAVANPAPTTRKEPPNIVWIESPPATAGK